MGFQFGPLADDAAWQALDQQVGLTRSTDAARYVFQAFRDVGAACFLYEPKLVDRDFSAAFASFYASLFTPYLKYCRRLHFFAVDVSAALNSGDPQLIAELLEANSSEYLGFVVLRPLAHAPVGLAIISSVHFAKDTATEISVRARYKVHALGAELEVTGAPLTQQDTRVGACAQAAIWTVGRHLHNRHGGAWFSMPDISELALKPTDATISQSVPAGSSFLTLDNMVRALRGMDRHPVVFSRPADGVWVTAPRDVIYRYLDSGIPVIIGLKNADEAIGHAVVAVGRTIDKSAPANLPLNPTLAEGVTNFLVMDDQRGPYRKLPVAEADRSADYPWTVEADCQYVIVPLPSKVFMPGELADTLARGLIKQLLPQRTIALQKVGAADISASELDGEFESQAASDQLVSRTYLTYGWKYRARALRNSLPTQLKKALIEHPLPRYVWVTEFSKSSESYDDDPCKARVQAHAVYDATGSQFWDSALIAESPGFSVLWRAEPSSPQPQTNFEIVATPAQGRSWPKVRGWTDFSVCQT